MKGIPSQTTRRKSLNYSYINSLSFADYGCAQQKSVCILLAH